MLGIFINENSDNKDYIKSLRIAYRHICIV